MHWPIQATVLILCIVTCAAQGRGARRFSSTSVQDVIAEEDVVKNHRFQSRHGTRSESKRDEITANSREFPTRNQPAEVAATKKTISSRIDNEISRSVSSRPHSTKSRERTGQQSSTTTATTARQYSSRSSRVLDNNRRRVDIDISTEEAVTRGNFRSRVDRTRTSTVNNRQDHESTTVQSRSRNFVSREKGSTNQEGTTANTNHLRTRNGNNGRQSEGSNRVGRGRSISLDEPTTQSLRPRNRGYEKTLITDSGKSSSVRFNEGKSSTRLGESRNFNNRGNDQRSNDDTISARGRGRVSGRGRGNISPRAESPPTPAVETISTKDVEEIPASASSEIPADLASEEQLTSVEITQKPINIPLMQLIADVSSDEPFHDHSTTRKLNENGNSLEPTISFLEEKIKEATTATSTISTTSTSSTEPTTRSSLRGRVRKLPSGRRTLSRNDNNKSNSRNGELDTAENVETVTRSNRRNSQRFTSRPTTTTAGRGTVDRLTPSTGTHQGGRNFGRSREYISRNDLPKSRTDNTEPTTSGFRSRNNLYTTSSGTTEKFSQLTTDDHTQNYDNSVSVIADKRIKVQIPSVVDIEVNKAFSSDSELIQINHDHSTISGERFSVTSDNPVNSGRKPGRGSARASKVDVII